MRRAIATFVLAFLSTLAASSCDKGQKTAATSEEGAGTSVRAPGPDGAADAGATPASAAERGGAPAPATARQDPPQALAAGSEGTTTSGIGFRVLTAGAGPSPAAGATVRVHCRGWILERDGSRREFVDTHRAGIPERYMLTHDLVSLGRRAFGPDAPRPLIPGLVEVIAQMRTGEKREVRVPARLGYGQSGNLPLVPPNADLVFEVELVGVDPAQ